MYVYERATLLYVCAARHYGGGAPAVVLKLKLIYEWQLARVVRRGSRGAQWIKGTAGGTRTGLCARGGAVHKRGTAAAIAKDPPEILTASTGPPADKNIRVRARALAHTQYLRIIFLDRFSSVISHANPHRYEIINYCMQWIPVDVHAFGQNPFARI